RGESLHPQVEGDPPFKVSPSAPRPARLHPSVSPLQVCLEFPPVLRGGRTRPAQPAAREEETRVRRRHRGARGAPNSPSFWVGYGPHVPQRKTNLLEGENAAA